MKNLQVCLYAVLPILLMMALGYLAQRLHAISREDVPKLNKMMFHFFMPIMMFYDLYTSDISHAIQPAALLFAAGGVLAVFGACAVFVVRTEKDPEKRGVKIQGMYRSNFIIIGLPLSAALVEGADLGPIAVMVAVVIPLFNALAIITLEVFNGNKSSPRKLLLDILKNPLIIGIAAGILALLLHIKLPRVIESTMQQITAAANPLLLFLLGAFFQFSSFGRYRKDLLQVCLARLAVIPLVMLTAAYLLGFRGVVFAGLLSVFGSATAITSFTMTQQMGGDSELAGDIVALTSALCPFTLFLLSLLFKALGAF